MRPMDEDDEHYQTFRTKVLEFVTKSSDEEAITFLDKIVKQISYALTDDAIDIVKFFGTLPSPVLLIAERNYARYKLNSIRNKNRVGITRLKKTLNRKKDPHSPTHSLA